ncbi:sodium:proton antiporter, partial [Aliarcobacter butzleri]
AKRYMIASDKLITFLNSQDEVSNAEIQPIMPAGVSACSSEGQKIKAQHDEAKKSCGSCGSGCGCH